jgi:acyl-CoA synthetase (AMP-forming)/AMP-acid ligase II
MLSRLIFDEPGPSNRQAIVTPLGSVTWSGLRRKAEWILETQKALGKRRVGLPMGPGAASYAALAALDKLSCDVVVLDGQLSFPEIVRLSERFQLGAVLRTGTGGQASELEVHELPNEERWSGTGTVTILTSGSTGEPKAVRHTWESVARPVRKGLGLKAPTWLLTYRPNLYAGLQVMLQCFADRGTLAVPDLNTEPQATAQFMLASGVRFVSATPSYWRRLLMFADHDLLRRVPLEQITLGGEVVDQPLLDRLQCCYPDTRIVHIYATTELGRCFSVTDGLAGFPARYLAGRLPDGTEMKVQDGELLVRSPNSMRMYDPLSSQQLSVSDWFATGDLVEIKGDRAYFVGRRSDMINVAGSKVHPLEVERVIRAIPGVSDVRVFGKASSIVGELVACEIVASCQQGLDSLKEEVIRTCRARLSAPQQPRLIRFVQGISVSAAGKTLRTMVS